MDPHGDSPTQHVWHGVAQVKVDRQPFAKGGLRYAYYVRLLHDPDTPYVAKAFIDSYEDPMTYFQVTWRGERGARLRRFSLHVARSCPRLHLAGAC